MKRWRVGAIERLGNGATVAQEADHFIHKMTNRIAILGLRMELANRERADRLRLRARGRRP